MKSIIHFLTRPWFLTLVGVLTFSLVIWFLGDWIGLRSDATKTVAILTLMLIVGLYQSYQLVKINRATTQLMSSLTTASVSETTEQLNQEVETLSKNLSEALQTLKKTHKGAGGSHYLYELPWYMLIGAPGSGKTTALINSGLTFPLGNTFGKGGIRGVGGTKDCDFWFTDQAVILDTAGRYTTQDSGKAVDSGVWLNFLGLLKKFRPRRPINGVLITMSFSDLLLSEVERKKQAAAIRQRIDELHQHFGIRFPIYMILTKGDLIAGFNEFFSDLERQEIQQVWGMTFEVDYQASSEAMFAQINQHFDELLAVLQIRMLKRLQEEREVERRALIFSFPQRLTLLRDNLQEFLNECYGGNRYQTSTPYLRGVYLTSATQEGTPIDRLMSVMAESFRLDNKSLPMFSGKGKSFFFTRLLKEVIFQEAQLVSLNPKIERFERWLRYGALGATLAVIFSMSTLWFVSYQKNQQALGEVNKLISEYNQVENRDGHSEKDFSEVLERLDKVQKIGSAFQNQSSLWMRFGLYQGNRVQSEINKAYETLLFQQFLPHINHRIKFHIKEQFALQCDKDNFLLAWLGAYLMLHGESGRFNATTISKIMEWDWSGTYGNDPQVQVRLKQHLAYLLALKSKSLFSASEPLFVADAQRVLKDHCSPEQQIYMGLVSKAKETAQPDLKVMDALGALNASQALATKRDTLATLNIPYLYTYKGFYNFFVKQLPDAVKDFSKDNWIRGTQGQITASSSNPEALKNSIYTLYYADYIAHWDKMLNNLTIKQSHSPQERQDVLNVLSLTDASPLLKLEALVKKETKLSTPQPAAEFDPTKELQNAALSKVNSGIRTQAWEARKKEEARKNLPPAIDTVESHYQDFALGESFATLKKLYDDCSLKLSASSAPDPMTVNHCLEEATRLENSSALLREPLKSITHSVAAQSKGEIEGSAKKALNDQWKQDVLPSYNVVKNAYPFNRSSSSEVSSADLTMLFTKLDAFINSHSTTPLGQAKAVKDNMQRMFFSNGTQQPSVKFTLQLAFLSPEAQKIKVTIEGKPVEFSNTGTMTEQFQWSPSSPIKFVFETTSPLPEKTVLEAWHLLAGNPITFEDSGVKAEFKLIAESGNPFSHSTKLTLPASL